MRRFPYVSLLLSVAALIVHLALNLRVSLIFDRTAIASNELWRLATCHWVHLNVEHLFWSGMTFFVLASACEVIDKIKTYVTLGISAVSIPIIIYFARPDLQIYAGLSGIDCAFYTLLLAFLIKSEIGSKNQTWIVLYFLLLILLIIKAAFEAATGLTLFVSNDHLEMTPVPLAHLVGGIIGLVVGLFGDRNQPNRVAFNKLHQFTF